MLFDPADRHWKDKVFQKTESVDDRMFNVWGI